MGGFGFSYEKLKEYSNRFGFKIDAEYFIETGTNKGRAVIFMQSHFSNVWSIELSENLFNKFMNKANAYKNVSTFLGDSEKILPELCEKAKGKAIFYLDAHYCYSDSAKGKTDCPLIEEIKAINKRNYEDIIICDDLMYFNKVKEGLDWRHVTIDRIKDILGKDKKYIEYDDRLIILRG